jgi:hypothetical protein
VIVNGEEITMVADSTYIYTSIIEPDKELVKGYGAGVMRSYKNVIPHEDIVDLINYFKSLKEEE